MEGIQKEQVRRDRVRFVKLADIKEGRRYREDYGDLSGMVASIREKGVLQPITLSSDLTLLAGGRRLRSAREAGLLEIPALIREISGEVDLREIELIENIIRKDLTWDEEANLIREIDRLYKSKQTDWSLRKTANLLDKGVATVSRAVKLADALDRIPELADVKTADDALKVIGKMEEQIITAELRRRQESDSLARGVKAMLKLADQSYIVGDTFKGLSGLKNDGKIDIIECDPPYGIDLSALKRGKEEVTSNVRTYNEVPGDKYEKFLTSLAYELYRVAARDSWLIFWYGPTWHTQVLGALRTAGWAVDDIPCIWVKSQGQTNAPEYYLARAYEPFFLCRKGKPILVKRGRLNVFQFPGDAGQVKYHPTQRPIALMEELLGTLGVDLQTVLVPFLGSGVTIRAAYRLGMRAYGWDISGEYKDKFMLSIEQDARTLNGEEV